jgi:hypothetical protein
MALVKKTVVDKVEGYMKDIVGFEGLYAITKDGKVWSYPKEARNNLKGKWLSNDKSSRYHQVSLMKDGVKYKRTIHKLVATAFCEGFDDSLQVNHIDGDKLNNNATNLEWISASENRLHSWRTGLQTATDAHKASARKQGIARRLFSDVQVREIRILPHFGKTQRNIAAMFNTSQAVINYILTGKTYKEIM